METKPISLTAQTEKPNHYTYLKEFRVDQCPSFLQHKCNQHRPFICFNWHFMNQRRRRPVRRRDGSFNYSADNYCTKYDETTGICPDGDDCPFLHRTAGDTERRYHLRYYKTCMCVHDTDSRGYCVKNGHHCAFAHGVHDQRPPVYDIKELEALQASEVNPEGTNGPNVLDKERNLMNEDPKWQDTNYVLANYKTEPCKRPPRLCRQGYACPQYHNSKDKRRSPRKYKYRSTPCPNVKHGEEWGEPTNCEAGDNCQYCHTRTEQQFHPEIYKSTKCNDVQQAGYCPRSVFCAFAHVEPYVLTEDLTGRDLDGSNPLGLSDMMSSVMSGDVMKKDKLNDLNNLSFNQLLQNGSAESSESASTSSLGSNNSNHNRAPGSQLQQKNSNSLTNNNQISIHTSSISNNTTNSIVSNPFPHFTSSDLAKQFLAMSTLDGVGYGLDSSLGVGLGSLRNPSAPVRIPGSPMSSLLENTSPIDIPGSSISNFSPSHSNLFPVGDHFGHVGSGSHPGGSVPKINNSFGHTADFLFTSSHLISPGLGDGGLSISPELRLSSELNSMNNDLSNSASNRLFDNHLQQSKHPFPMSPLVNSGISEIGRLRDELANKNHQMINWEEQLSQANKVCDAWKKEMEESNRKFAQYSFQAVIAEQQRDEALGHVKSLKDKLDQISIAGTTIKASELKGMPLHKLKNLQAKLRAEMEEVEKVLYLETATKCMTCEENNRTVTLVPCNHYVLCDSCAATQRECPYCQTPVTSQA